MTESIRSMLMKLNRLHVEQYKNYYSKNIDFIAYFAHVQYVLRLIHGTHQFGLRFPLSSAVMA